MNENFNLEVKPQIMLFWTKFWNKNILLADSLGETLENPSLVLMKARKDMNNVSLDITEVLLKAALNIIQPTNQTVWIHVGTSRFVPSDLDLLFLLCSVCKRLVGGT